MFKGSIVAIVTPFKNGAVDEEKLRELVEFQIVNGTVVGDIVGPICESGDFLVKEREFPNFQQGDLIAFLSAGAYGFTMSSNYNSRPRVAEVMVKGDKFEVVRARETVEELVRGERIPSFL